jgi:hypothetical protein
MKITYTPNPLNTIVELDEHEKREMWHTIRFNEMLDMLFTVHYELTCKEGPDMERIKKEVDPAYYLEEKERTGLDKRCDQLLEHFIENLQLYSHAGDCTAFPASCSKCHAEAMLGIDTIPGMSKSIGHQVYHRFNYKDGETWKERTLDEVLDLLAANPHGQAAHAWLTAHRNTHFPKD